MQILREQISVHAVECERVWQEALLPEVIFSEFFTAAYVNH